MNYSTNYPKRNNINSHIEIIHYNSIYTTAQTSMKEFTVTIIIPVYNVEKYIKRCLLSVMNQTFTYGIECILINDATPDDSILIAKTLIDQYKGDIVFRIISHQYNRGVAAARNTGLKAAKGTYIQYIDGDDYVEPDMLEKLYQTAIKTKGDIIVSDYYSEFKSKTIHSHQQKITSPEKCISLLLRTEIPGYLWNKLLRKDIIYKNKIQFIDGVNMWEDLIFLIQIYLTSPRIVYLPYASYHYVKYNSQSIVSNINYTRTENKIKACSIVFEILKGRNIYEKYKLDFVYLVMEAKSDYFITKGIKNYQRWEELWPEMNRYILQMHKRLDIRLIYWLAAKKCYNISRLIIKLKNKLHKKHDDA